MQQSYSEGLSKHLLVGVGKNRAKASRLEMAWHVMPFRFRTTPFIASSMVKKKNGVFSLLAQDWSFKGEVKGCNSHSIPGLK